MLGERRPEPAAVARKRRILFVSTRNAARSLLAAAWLRQIAGEQVEVDSAGTGPAAAPHPVAIAVMLEAGIDLSCVRPRSVASVRAGDYDLVIVLAAREEAAPPPIEDARELAYWSFDDPAKVGAAQQVPAFRRIRDEIRLRLSQLE